VRSPAARLRPRARRAARAARRRPRALTRSRRCAAPSACAFLSSHHKAPGGADAPASARLYCFHLASGRVVGESLCKSSTPQPLSLSAPGRLLAAFDRNSVSVWDVSAVTAAHSAAAAAAALARAPPPLRLRHTKPLTCLALCPREERVAAGDATGRLLVWHGLRAALAAAAAQPAASAAAGAQPQPTPDAAAPLSLSTLHWHASALRCLAWSPCGSRLFSGGEEGVLVLWRAEDGGRTFLPRLGAPLAWLAQSPADAAILAIGCADNVAHIGVNVATLAPGGPAVRGPRPAFLRPSHAASAFEAPAQPLWDARARAALLPAAGGGLQWYDAAAGRGVGELYVSEAGAQPAPPPPPRAAGGPPPPRPLEPHVALCALRPGSGSLATVDRRGEGAVGGVGSPLSACIDTLRFWSRVEAGEAGADGGAASPRFALSTRVEHPHGPHAVSALAHHPRAALAATASAGGAQFKVWAAAGGGGGRPAWRVRSVGFYQQRPMCAAAFSSDGSLLAVGAGDAVTLWEVESNALLSVLHPPCQPALQHLPPSPPVTHLAFPGAEAEESAGEAAPPLPMLYALSGGGGGGGAELRLWDLLSLRPAGSVGPLGGVSSFAADPWSDSVALALAPPPSWAKTEGPPSRVVLRFAGPTAALAEAWTVQLGAEAAAADEAALLFAPRTQLWPRASGAAAAGAALLLVTPERRFILASSEGDEALQEGAAEGRGGALAAGAEAEAAAAEVAAAAGPGLERTFGSLRVEPPAAAAAAAGAAAGAGVERGAPAAPEAWVSPFKDVPSHALPSLAAMLPAYLDSLLRCSEGLPAPAAPSAAAAAV